MRLNDIALNNLRRRKIKSVFLIMGLVFGVATIVTLLSITSAMKNDMGKKLEGVGSKIIIKPKSDSVAFTYGPIVIASGVAFDVKELTNKSLETVKKQKQINIVSAKILDAVKIDNKEAMVVGVDFNQELKLKNYWDIQGAVPAKADEVLVGAKVAKIRNFKVGSRFEVKGQTFTVAGIIDTTANEEDGLIFLDLKKSQQLFDKTGTLTFIEANVAGTKNAGQKVDEVVQALRSQLPEAEVTAVKEAVDARKQLVDRFTNFTVVISIIVVFIGSLIVMSTMLSSVNERTREIGIFRAIGFRKSHIMKIILFEAGVVSFIGTITGYLIGLLAAMNGAVFVTKMALNISWNPLLMISVIVFGVLIGLLSSLYPAIKASRLDPVEALRFI